MTKEKAVVILNIPYKSIRQDIEIPLDITANELLVALDHAYKLGIDTENVMNCYVKTENPIALIKGNRTFAEYGVRNGTVINITK